ncbi:MAG: DegV family protein [Oscillospiraceae bacterium]|jgi:DegV family protein with EDD domain|nr:DegV family protein [Oscillospiraceae bacterium]
MANVKILTDSTCDLTADIIERYNIGVIPLYVTLDKDSLRDGEQVAPRDLYAYFERTKKTPKTSTPTIADFTAVFEPYASRGMEIVFIGISEAMSTTVNNARAAAAEFPGSVIRCVNSQNLSTGVGLVVLEACELARRGLGAEQIEAALIEMVPRVRASFVLDTLTYLYHGGRCSAVQSIGSMLLRIKPRIEVVKGEMTPTEKFRGSFANVARQYAQSALGSANPEYVRRIDPRRAFITDTVDTDRAAVDAVREEAESLHIFESVTETHAGCVITSHCGQNTIGVLFVEKP